VNYILWSRKALTLQSAASTHVTPFATSDDPSFKALSHVNMYKIFGNIAWKNRSFHVSLWYNSGKDFEMLLNP
jgi:hypothetical protein